MKELFNKPFRPTKWCPHRMCKILHPFLGLAVLMVYAHDVLADWRMWLIVLMLLPVMVLTMWWAEGKSPVQAAIEEAAHTGTGGLHLVVTRPVWARVAVGCDVVLVAAQLWILGEILSTDDAPTVPVTPAQIGILIAGAAGPGGFSLYAHRKATDPVKPKRAPAWVRALSPLPEKG